MKTQEKKTNYREEFKLAIISILLAAFVIGGLVLYVNLTNYIYTNIPQPVPFENAIAILNDLITFDGVLIGFASVVAGLNITEIYRIRSKGVFVDEYEARKEYEEYHERRVNIAFDFMVLGVLSFAVFNALIVLANLNAPVNKFDVSSNIGDTLIGLLAMAFRLYSVGVIRSQWPKLVRVQFPKK